MYTFQINLREAKFEKQPVATDCQFLFRQPKTTGWLKSFESKNERMCIF